MRYDRLAAKYEALKHTIQNAGEDAMCKEQTCANGDMAGAAGGDGPNANRLECFARVDLLGSGRVVHHAGRDSSLLVSKGCKIGRLSLLAGANHNNIVWHSVHSAGGRDRVMDIATRSLDDLVLSCGILFIIRSPCVPSVLCIHLTPSNRWRQRGCLEPGQWERGALSSAAGHCCALGLQQPVLAARCGA
jgi:hypothetical protein